MRFFILLLCICLCAPLWGEDDVKDQIQQALRDNDLLEQPGTRRHQSSGPNGLKRLDGWAHKSGDSVESFELQNSSDVRVTAYLCYSQSLYWLRIKGTILDIDLWYGPYRFPRHARNNRSYFSEHFRQEYHHHVPALKPLDLTQNAGYRCIRHRHMTQVFSLLPLYPDYELFAYYCSRGRHYWIRSSGYGGEEWYGPFNLSSGPIPVPPSPEKEIVAGVSLDKSNYRTGESIRVQVWVKNLSRRGVWLKFSSGAGGDYIIDDSYQWAEDRMSTQALNRVYVPPRGRKTILSHRHSSNDYYLSPGRHEIVGIVKTRNYGELRTDATSFRVSGGYPVPVPNPGNSSQLINKAVRYIKLRQYVQARRLLLKAARQDPNNELVYYNLACVESLTYKIDKALDYLEKALELGYNDFDHMEKDRDLDNIRRSDRYYELLEMYGGIGSAPGIPGMEDDFEDEG